MPGLILFRRRMKIGSDDLVFPGLFETILRIAWLVAIAVIFHIYRETFVCEGGHILQAYHIGVLVMLSASILLTSMLTFISMQGTMMYHHPRRKVTTLLYIKFALAVPELGWNILGTYWAFGRSYGCDWQVVAAVKGAVICGWIVVIIVLVSSYILFDPVMKEHDGVGYDGDRSRVEGQVSGDRMTGAHQLESSAREQILVSAKSAASRVWETRCKVLCCLATCDERSQAAFTDISKIIADFFEDVDLVPTDIAAGLILVQKEHERQEIQQSPDQMRYRGSRSPFTHAHGQFVSGADVDTPSYMSKRPAGWMTIKNMAHYAKFAIGSYGWPFYMYMNLCTGLCKLYTKCRCCACLMSPYRTLGDNACDCNTAAILRHTDMLEDDLIYASFHNRIYEIPFYVAIDRERQAVVVAIRGTLSLKDAITDLSAESDGIDVAEVAGCYAHKGILSAAKFIKQKLQDLQLLKKAFLKIQSQDLVITGHSLGSGAAALLTLLLKPEYPQVRCFAYSPPGGLLSKSLAECSQTSVCSVIVGKDLVPRLALPTMHDLKIKLLKAIKDCPLPKYNVLMGGCWRALCGSFRDGGTSLNQPLLTDLHSNQYSALSGLEESLEDAIASSEQTAARNTYDQLYPPGQILHIIEIEEAESWFGKPRYSAIWSNPDSFCEIIVSPKMVTDHLPDTVLSSLEQLQSRDIVPHLNLPDAASTEPL